MFNLLISILILARIDFVVILKQLKTRNLLL